MNAILDKKTAVDFKPLPGQMVAVCAWCVSSTVQNNLSLSGANLTHGVCPECKTQFQKTVERNKAIQANANKIDFALPK